MNRIYAPWRMKYIRQGTLDNGGCFLCEKLASDNDRENLVLKRGAHCFALLNLFPYSNGHIMIAPNRHIADYKEITDDEIREAGVMTRFFVELLERKMSAQGFNIGYNVGRVAGAGCDTHLHQHIVPRWNGDTNFMPVLGDVKVIPEGLLETYDLIKEAMGEG